MIHGPEWFIMIRKHFLTVINISHKLLYFVLKKNWFLIEKLARQTVIDASPSHYVPYHVGLRMPFFPTRWMPTLDWFVEMVLRPAQVGWVLRRRYICNGWMRKRDVLQVILSTHGWNTDNLGRSIGSQSWNGSSEFKNLCTGNLKNHAKNLACLFFQYFGKTLPLFRHCLLDGVWSVHLLISEDPCYYKLIHYYSERGRNNSTSILWKLCNSIFKYSSFFLPPKLQTIDISWCKVFHFTPPRNFVPIISV